MAWALAQLAEDFLSTIVFLVAYLVTRNLTLAVSLAIAVGIGQLAVMRWRGRPVEVMQGLSLGLVIVLGAASLITNDSRFIMIKPSIIHFAIGAVMLRPGWMTRYLPPIVRDNVSERVLVITGYAWAALMFALGLTNLYVATFCSVTVWGWFISVGAGGAKILALVVQYLIFRVLIVRRLRTAPSSS